MQVDSPIPETNIPVVEQIVVDDNIDLSQMDSHNDTESKILVIPSMIEVGPIILENKLKK